MVSVEPFKGNIFMHADNKMELVTNTRHSEMLRTEDFTQAGIA
jgi:hypothetical protein